MRRIIINAFRNIRRAPYQALAAVMVLTLTFFVAQLFIVLTYSTNVVTHYFETRPQVIGFFKDEITEAQLLLLKEQLEKQAFVKQVTYVSKQEALKIYKELNKDDPLLLEMVTADILPASLEVSATAIEYLPQVKAELEKSKGVGDVVYQEDVIETMQRWSTGIKAGGISLVIFLTVTSLLVITLIISMKVSTKKQEIATMKLLGARPGFVVGPFIAEGALYGLAASLISWTTLVTILLYTTPMIVEFMGEIPLLPLPLWFLAGLLGATSLFSLFIGMIAGNVSGRRFGN